MHQWLVFAHVAAVLGFMLAHGVQVTAMWKMRMEPDPARTAALFDVLPGLLLLRISLGVVVITGLLATFTGPWAGDVWPWLSLGLLVTIWLAMWRFGAGYYGLISETAGKALEAESDQAARAAAQSAFDAARGSWHTIGMTVIGLGGVGVILWLMMFKPF